MTVRGPLIDALETDMENGDHRAVDKLLFMEKYQPTDAEREVWRFAPMGSTNKALSIARRERIAPALVRYRELGDEGLTVAERKEIIMREYVIQTDEFELCVEHAGDKGVRDRARELEETDA